MTWKTMALGLGLILAGSALKAQEKSYRIEDRYEDTSRWKRKVWSENLETQHENGAYQVKYKGGQLVTLIHNYGHLNHQKAWQAVWDFHYSPEKGKNSRLIFVMASTNYDSHYKCLSFTPESNQYQFEETKKNANPFVIKRGNLEAGQLSGSNRHQLTVDYEPIAGNIEEGLFSVKLDGVLLFKQATNPLGGIFGIQLQRAGELKLQYFGLNQEEEPINLASGLPPMLKRELLSDSVNTLYSDISPVISADGRTLYYSVKRDPKNMGGVNDLDEIWYSELGADGQWGARVNMGKPLNNDYPNSVLGLSVDGNMVYLRGHYLPDGSPNRKTVGISRSFKDSSGNWSVPEVVQVEDYHNLTNTSEFCLSPDGKMLIMTAQRRGDAYFKSKDLYASRLQPDGSWGKPFNLGPVVNSAGRESAPFLAADNQTLYFASDGHPGYGQHDIYLSRRLDDTWTNWSKPENLGSSINSEGWEAYFTLPASGAYAYMASNQMRKGFELDIIRVELAPSQKPLPVVLIKGRVLHAETLQPLEALINYADLNTQKPIGTARSEGKTGRYSIVLPAGQAYEFLAEKSGFFAVSDYLDIAQSKELYREIERDLYLSPIRAGVNIRLNNLFFDTNKFELRPESKGELHRLAELMRRYPKMRIKLQGHTDSQGTRQNNLVLSDNRAQAVVKYMESAEGLDKGRFEAQGFGPDKPVADNQTPEGRQLNRRVEFLILSMD